jgi:hypothetical protein
MKSLIILLGIISTSCAIADTKIACGDLFTDKLRKALFKTLSYKGLEGSLETEGLKSLNCVVITKFHHEKSKKTLMFLTDSKNVLMKIQVSTTSAKTMDCKSVEITDDSILIFQ